MNAQQMDNATQNLNLSSRGERESQSFAVTHEWGSALEQRDSSPHDREPSPIDQSLEPIERNAPQSDLAQPAIPLASADLPLETIAPAGDPSGSGQGDSEECLTEYISQLFDRLGVQSETSPPPMLEKSPQSKRLEKSAGPRDAIEAAPVEERTQARKPTPKVGTEQLSQMRDLANRHTRGAVQTHEMDETIRNLFGKLFIAVACMAAAFALSTEKGAAIAHSTLLATMTTCVAAVYTIQFVAGCRKLPRQLNMETAKEKSLAASESK